MAKPPIQFFRKEDFSEVQEPWVDKLLPKLNELARQTTYGIDGKLSVSENLSGFWWKGDIINARQMSGVNDWYNSVAPASFTPPSLPASRITPSVQGFPFSFPNQLTPAKVAGIFVGQAFDVTSGSTRSVPALLGGVAWEAEGNSIKISGIAGMLPDRCYNVKLLVLGE